MINAICLCFFNLNGLPIRVLKCFIFFLYLLNIKSTLFLAFDHKSINWNKILVIIIIINLDWLSLLSKNRGCVIFWIKIDEHHEEKVDAAAEETEGLEDED